MNMHPGQKRVLNRPLSSAQGGHWVDQAVQTLFGNEGATAGQTIYSGADSNHTPSLVALSTDLLLIGVRIPKSGDLGDPKSLQKLLLSYFNQFDRESKLYRKPPELADQAKYALTAFIDEVVMQAGGEIREFWSTDSLQMKFYQDNLAGENFFLRLQEMLREPQRFLECIEVYYLCLALGFQGRYRVRGNEKLPTIVGNLFKKIKSIRKPSPVLSPAGYVPTGKLGRETSIKRWLIASAAAISLTLIYFFSLQTLNNIPLDSAKSVVERLNSSRFEALSP